MLRRGIGTRSPPSLGSRTTCFRTIFPCRPQCPATVYWARIVYAFLRLFARSRTVLAAVCWSGFVAITTSELCTSATRHRACAPVAPRTPTAIHWTSFYQTCFSLNTRPNAHSSVFRRWIGTGSTARLTSSSPTTLCAHGPFSP